MTTEPTPEELRVFIAEKCGYMRTTRLGKDVLYDPAGGHILIADAHNHLPDYCSDLNAMAEAEKVLTDEQKTEYGYALHDMHGAPFATFWIRAICSSALQRARAFYKVIGGGK